jgi:murein DD-endopeptidase MepM/ murein hydrolase activator NlpD
MSKKFEKWPFSIILDKKKIKLKDKVKGLKSWKWIYLVVIIFFMVLGGMYAFYQENYFSLTEEPHFERTSGQEKEARVEIIDVKEDLDNYKLDREEITIPSSLNNTEENSVEQEDIPAIKVIAKPTSIETFGSLIKPIDSNIILSWNEPYKDRVLDAWKFNSGVDFKAEIGTKIKAVQDGIVEEIIKDDYQGTTVIIKHNDTFKTLYGNLQNIYLEEGEKISTGQALGEVGDSGLSDESKLHFEVIKIEDGQEKRISPLQYLK